MQRRTLLASVGAAAALSGFGGCSFRFDDPTIRGTPMPPYTPPPPPPYPGAAEAARLETEAWAALLGAAAAPGADAASLGRLAAVRGAHVAVLSTPQPAWRRPAEAPVTPPAAMPAATREAGFAAAGVALATLREATIAKAVSAEGGDAVLWAALAASAEQARLWLGTPVAGITPGVPGRAVATLPDPTAFDRLVEGYHEAVYGLSSLVGFLPSGSRLRPVLTTLLGATRTRRDALIAYDRAAQATPTPGAGAYAVPATDPDQVPSLAGRLLSAITGAAGVWVASATPQRRDRAVQELLYAAGAGLPLGSGLAEWPGWPD